jgi:hypothetical protein
MCKFSLVSYVHLPKAEGNQPGEQFGVLSHTLAVHFCQREDFSPLRF